VAWALLVVPVALAAMLGYVLLRHLNPLLALPWNVAVLYIALGFRQFRVRFHGDIVRLEIAPEEMAKALTPDMARCFTAVFKPLGFKYVTLDLEGYRQGSLNEVLPR